ncbi:DUF4935 domain-containing protein [Tolypothrix sp. PCC 7910]|uniref:PIN domain-containing protein n=1 Tax=Tolypothrix sp. PCC 7910 TaxID=2099387 RepID=UPI0014278919|nr:PIN domain-containing protein [Tolypothrix sp. PCC 7910]QIR36313.1 DUF4935 domain-containing protein [Tolypothrix sp. PCC 7910]
MKDLFPGHFRRSEQEWQSLWEKAKIVLDTNFLLDLYRYSEGTRKEIFEILNSIKDRLFIPYQVAFEFMQNRLDVIAEQGKSYDLAISNLQKINGDFNNNKRHPFIEPSLLQELNELISKLIEDLTQGKALFDKLLVKDSIINEIADLFEGKVGNPLSDEDFKNLCDEGEDRYKRLIPPGYKDISKPVPDKFGDLIIWKQIIALARNNKCDIIFITNDVKEDWWWTFNGKKIGPRHELVQEIKKEADCEFYIYLPDNFIKYSGQYLQSSVEQQVIDEIKEISKKSTETLKISSANSVLADELADDISVNNFPDFIDTEFSSNESIQLSLMNPSLEDARRLIIQSMKFLIRQGKKNVVPKAGLKNMMTRLDPTFDESNYEVASFSEFLSKFPNDIITLDNYSGGHVALTTKALFNN